MAIKTQLLQWAADRAVIKHLDADVLQLDAIDEDMLRQPPVESAPLIRNSMPICIVPADRQYFCTLAAWSTTSS